MQDKRKPKWKARPNKKENDEEDFFFFSSIECRDEKQEKKKGLEWMHKKDVKKEKNERKTFNV